MHTWNMMATAYKYSDCPATSRQSLSPRPPPAGRQHVLWGRCWAQGSGFGVRGFEAQECLL